MTAGTVRVFCAVVPPAPVRDALKRRMEDLARCVPEARFVRPEQLHVTLRFLGDVDVDGVAAAEHVLSTVAARSRPFRLVLRGLGVFPNPVRPRVLWCGVGEGKPRLEALARELDRGFAVTLLGHDDKPFRAHLTLARWRNPPALPVESLLAEPLEPGRFTVEELRLYRSELGGDGVRYSVLGTWPLQA